MLLTTQRCKRCGMRRPCDTPKIYQVGFNRRDIDICVSHGTSGYTIKAEYMAGSMNIDTARTSAWLILNDLYNVDVADRYYQRIGYNIHKLVMVSNLTLRENDVDIMTSCHTKPNLCTMYNNTQIFSTLIYPGCPVTIRDDLEAETAYGGDIFITDMLPFKGQRTIVLRRWRNITHTHILYNIQADDGRWAWTDEMLKRC